MSSIKSIIIALVILFAILLISGCDYQEWTAADLPGDEDEVADGDDVIPDGDTGIDGDVEVSGAGSLAKPLQMVGLQFSGTGDIASMLSEITGESSIPAPPVMTIVDGDTDTELELSENEIDSEIETDVISESDITEAETDGDLDHSEVETDIISETDVISETDTVSETDIVSETDKIEAEKESEPVTDYGSGPEVVVQLDLKKGDTVKVSWKGAGFDGVLYLLPTNNASAKAENFKDIAVGIGLQESMTYIATADGTLYLVLDTKLGASGTYSFEIIIEPDLGGGTPPEDGMVGAACEVPEDCNTDYCLTSKKLESLLNSPIDVTNGYCSTVDLFVDYCSDECNEANGGFCMSGGFVSKDYAVVNLCLRPCEVTGDCRPQDNNICVNPQKWVDNGWISAATKQEYFEDYSLCIPSEFVDVLEEEMSLISGN